MKTLTEGIAKNLVKTWLERLPARLPEDQLNCTLKQVVAMQAEIDELRAVLQERDAKVPPAVLMNQLINDKLELSIKLAKQRKVLEQALEVIKYIGYVPRADGSHPVEKAITAIQEQLA